MILPDVNVLVYAARQEMPQHEAYRRLLAEMVARDEPFGVSDEVLAGFIRVATNPRVFEDPLSTDDAVGFCERVRYAPCAVVLVPGPRHWELFARLCRGIGARGNLVPDAYLAALAIEHGCVCVTNDTDFRRFPGLKWRRPFDDHVTTNP